MNDATELAAAVRAALTGAGAIREVKMFGGIGFMLNGHLTAGASRRGLLLRVGSERQAEALARPGARPMVMRGRTMEGYVYVDPPALDPLSLERWMALALPYVRSLPPKAARVQRSKAAARARPRKSQAAGGKGAPTARGKSARRQGARRKK